MIGSFVKTVDIGGRTGVVRDAILEIVGVRPNMVTEGHLSTIIGLDLDDCDIDELKIGDFDGLTGLWNLLLRNNNLTKFPEGIFLGLKSLKVLDLRGTLVKELPGELFLPRERRIIVKMDITPKNNKKWRW